MIGMAKLKLNGTVKRWHGGEQYIFKNGKAIVPNMTMCKRQVIITLKEFNTLIKDVK